MMLVDPLVGSANCGDILLELVTNTLLNAKLRTFERFSVKEAKINSLRPTDPVECAMMLLCEIQNVNSCAVSETRIDKQESYVSKFAPRVCKINDPVVGRLRNDAFRIISKAGRGRLALRT